ncbi:fimbrial protein [Serratia proteamaculans]|nr:fimbrial protein [Serratia proteamaculans]
MNLNQIFFHSVYLSIACLFFALGSAPAHAATVTVTATVLMPPCEINAGNAIDVDFGNDVMTTRIDGNSYQKRKVNYTVECEGTLSSPDLKLRINGSPAGFDNSLLTTNKAGLAVRFSSDSSNLALNSGVITFDYNATQPAVFAVLAKDPAVTLTGGAFVAAATMSVEYQ